MKGLLIIFSFFLIPFAFSKSLGVFYFDQMFGHVHKNASTYSSSLTTVTCGHPMRGYEIIGEKRDLPHQWMHVKVGGKKGYIKRIFLTNKKPQCFQDKYPKFFENFNLDLSELYYWGKLYDQFVQGKSRAH